jgi:hypothetical protein
MSIDLSLVQLTAINEFPLSNFAILASACGWVDGDWRYRMRSALEIPPLRKILFCFWWKSMEWFICYWIEWGSSWVGQTTLVTMEGARRLVIVQSVDFDRCSGRSLLFYQGLVGFGKLVREKCEQFLDKEAKAILG